MTVKTIVIPFVSLLATGAIAGTGVGVYFSIENAMNVCRLNFVGTNCLMKDDTNNVVETKDFKKGETAHFRLEGKDASYKMPLKEDVKFTYTITNTPFDGDYSYDPLTGNVSVVMLDNVTITASSFLQKYRLTFIGFNTHMKDESGNEVYTRSVVAGNVNHFYLTNDDPKKPIPAENDVEIVHTATGNPSGEYDYNKSTGEIYFTMTDDFTVIVKGSINYQLAFEGENCSLYDESGIEIIDKKEIKAGSTAHCILRAKDKHHHLPKKEKLLITYTKSGDLVNEPYTYDEKTGDILVRIIDNITITTTCDINTYTFTFRGTSCYAKNKDGDKITTQDFKAGDTANFYLAPEDGEHNIPSENNINLYYVHTIESIDYSYDESTGHISFVMLDDIVLNATSEVIEYRLTFDCIQCLVKDKDEKKFLTL